MKSQEKIGELKRYFKGRNRQELEENKIKDLLFYDFPFLFMLVEENGLKGKGSVCIRLSRGL